jgi:hypothetical protein
VNWAEVRDSIDRVLDYMWETEKADYEHKQEREGESFDEDGHIFSSLMWLNDFIAEPGEEGEESSERALPAQGFEPNEPDAEGEEDKGVKEAEKVK